MTNMGKWSRNCIYCNWYVKKEKVKEILWETLDYDEVIVTCERCKKKYKVTQISVLQAEKIKE